MDDFIYLEAYISNIGKYAGGNPAGEWVSFPTTAEQMKAVFDRIGIDGKNYEEWHITEYNSDIPGLTRNFSEYESLDELNYLGKLLEMQGEADRDKFAAAVTHGEYAGNVKDLINLAQNLDCYWLYPTVRSEEDYGYYLIEELDAMELPGEAKKYFKYEEYGSDSVINEGGSFTDQGYIYNNRNTFTEWYDGRDVPREYRVTPERPQPQRPDPEKTDMDAISTRQTATLTAEPPQPKPVIPIVLNSEKPAEKLKEITVRLEQGIKELFDSERYKEYLSVMSKFHNYSFNNTLLIAMQKPDASLVAGFSSWKNQFERNVKKGEKGIRIIAPSPFKVKKEMEKIDPKTQRPVIGRDGKPVTEQVEVTIPAFKVVSVFDASQTEGKELPDIAVDALTGDVEQYKDFFTALERTSPVPVGFEKIEGGAQGYYHLEDKRIALLDGASQLQTLKTLIHEIAHARLHDIDLTTPKEEQQSRPDRRTREVEAESIAYTVCQHYGLDTSDYSFGYVAGWSSNKELAELKSSLETIRNTAAELIDTIDGHIAELQKDREQTAEHQPGHEEWSEPATAENAPDNPGVPSDNISEYIPEQADTFSIYQLRHEDSTRDFRFEPYERLQAAGLAVDPANYEHIYTAPLTSGTTLGSLWERFNIDIPQDFKGHSLSVSDVVVLHQNGQTTAHYVDSFGFQKVPEFVKPENYLATAEKSTEQNYNMIDGQINNTPTVDELEAKVKAGEQISLTDLAAAIKADKERGGAKPEKKPSIRAQLKADKEKTPPKKTVAKSKTDDLERS